MQRNRYINTEILCNLFGFTEMKLDILAKELINKEFPDLKSNNPVLYVNTHALLSSLLYYFNEFVDTDKCNVFSIIKVLNYYEFSDNNESSMIYNPILIKVKDIDGYEFFKSAFYYQIFEKTYISLDVISVTFSILSNYVNDPNNLCSYEIISCSKEVLKLEEKLLKENDNKIESPYITSNNSKNNKYEAKILIPRKNDSIFGIVKQDVNSLNKKAFRIDDSEKIIENSRIPNDKVYQNNDIQSEFTRPKITTEEVKKLYDKIENINIGIKESLMPGAEITVVKNNNESTTYLAKRDENNHIVKDTMSNMQNIVDDLMEDFDMTPEIKEEFTKPQKQKIEEIFTENDII